MKLPVAEIESLDRAALIDAWGEVFGTPAPKRLSSPFLRRYPAFEMQAKERGGLPKGFVGKLQKATRDNRGTTSPALKPGGRLIRESNGATHFVDVVEDGFLWKGQSYASLLLVARAISGARWSGPRSHSQRRQS